LARASAVEGTRQEDGEGRHGNVDKDECIHTSMSAAAQ